MTEKDDDIVLYNEVFVSARPHGFYTVFKSRDGSLQLPDYYDRVVQIVGGINAATTLFIQGVGFGCSNAIYAPAVEEQWDSFHQRNPIYFTHLGIHLTHLGSEKLFSTFPGLRQEHPVSEDYDAEHSRLKLFAHLYAHGPRSLPEHVPKSIEHIIENLGLSRFKKDKYDR